MKNLSKKVILFALIVALLIPTFSASAEKLDEGRFPSPDSGTNIVANSTETEAGAAVANKTETEAGAAVANKTETEAGAAVANKTETEAGAGVANKTEAEAGAVTANKTGTEAVAAVANKTGTEVGAAVVSKVSTGSVPTSTRVAFSAMQSSIVKHRQTNPDVRGWLWMPNSNMSMPVVQGKNNDYYFGREWNGTDHPGLNWKNWVETSTYLDYRVQFGNSWAGSSNNIVLYGHNWTNLKAPYEIGNYSQHEMFAQLASYNDITYAKNNPYAYFSTDKLEGTWKIFAVLYHESSPKNIPYNTPNLNAEQFEKLVNEYRARSIFNYAVDIQHGDTLITFTTCTRNYPGVHDEQRFTVAARLLRAGENEQTAVTITPNPTIKQPSFIAG